MNEHFATTWEAIADAYPGDPAIIYGTRVRTWREFDDRASRLAAAMTAAGVGAGDTVAIDLYNCSEYLETFYAALKIRAVPANVNYRYLDDEMLHLLAAGGGARPGAPRDVRQPGGAGDRRAARPAPRDRG